MLGDLVISKAGHDKDARYIIIEETGDFVYLADGRLRGVGHPKKKRRKHIQPIYKYDTAAVREKLMNKQQVTDEEIKRIIKISKQSKMSEEE